MKIKGAGKLFELIPCKQNSPEWLELRGLAIGGSDVAAIMGLSPWRTPAEVWLEKTGKAEPEDLSDRPYVQRGHDLEDMVAAEYHKRHPDRIVHKVNAICRSIKRPWAQASLDREVCYPTESDQQKRWGVLEIKTARDDRDWQEGIPPYYLTQVTHFMSVTGRSFADVFVLFVEQWRYEEFHIERDEEDIEAVNAAVDGFWHDFVETDTMPELVGTDGESKGLAQWHRQSNGEVLESVGPEADLAISEYQDAVAAEKEAKERKSAAGAKLRAIIGDAKGIVTDVAKVTWSRSESSRLNAKKLKEDHPDIVSAYSTLYVRDGGLRITEVK